MRGGCKGKVGSGRGLGEDSLSLTELPFMKMKLRMTKRSPIFSFSLSLWQTAVCHPCGRGGDTPMGFPPAPKSSRGPPAAAPHLHR